MTERFARIMGAVALVFGVCLAAPMPALAAPLPLVSAGPAFAPTNVKAKVPTTVTYIASSKKTIVTGLQTTVVLAKSDGRAVMVKFAAPMGWQKVPYRYVKASKTLVYDEALRLKLGISSDLLGAPLPTRPGGGNGTLPVTGPSSDNITTLPAGEPCDPYTKPCAYYEGAGQGGPAPIVTTGNTADDGAAMGRLGGGWREEMLGAVNSLRASRGVAPLSLCGTLNRSAQGWAAYMGSTGQFGHNIAGSTASARMGMAGYGTNSVWGENIASGYGSVGEVVTAWSGSLGHMQNLVNTSVNHVGFGAAVGADGALYWVQNFGSRGTC